jgi:uncharacterized protein (TIGR02147 family)
MKSIYDFTDYREFSKTWIDSQEGSRGLRGRLAEAMGISSTMMSLMMKGEKNLSLEQAAEAAEFFGLNERETDYFFLLVEFGKAGTHKLQVKLRRQIREAQTQAKKISNRIPKDADLTDEVKAVFYSSWIYSAIRILSAVDGFNDVGSIAKRLQISPQAAANAIDFLLENHLCKKVNGKLTYGVARTHVASDSPFVNKHAQNWRLRGFQVMDHHNEDHLFYTKTMAVSAEAAEQIRRLLPAWVEEIDRISGPSDSEKVYCFNLDWFEY